MTQNIFFIFLTMFLYFLPVDSFLPEKSKMLAINCGETKYYKDKANGIVYSPVQSFEFTYYLILFILQRITSEVEEQCPKEEKNQNFKEGRPFLMKNMIGIFIKVMFMIRIHFLIFSLSHKINIIL